MAHLGTDAAVAIGNADSGYTDIGNVRSIDFGDSHDFAESTNNDSGGRKEGLLANSQVNLSISFVYDKSDAGQLELQQAHEAKSANWFRVRTQEDTGEREARFQGLITAYNVPNQNGTVVEATATIVSTGAITYADQ